MASSSTRDDTVDVGMVAADLRRQWWVVLVLVALGVTLGVVISVLAASSYTASSSLVVAPISTNPSSTSAPTLRDISMVTETRVVASGAVAALAAQRLGGGTTAPALLRGVHVTSPANSVVLHIRCSASTPAAASRRANAFADAYLAYRADLAVQRSRSVAAGLDARVLQLQSQVNDLAAGPGAGDPGTAEQRAKLLQDISDLRVRSSQLTASPVLAGTVVSPATDPGPPGPRRLVSFAVSGGLLGALVGLALALSRERRSDRLVDAPDMEEQVQAPVLAVLTTERSRRDSPRAPSLLRDPSGSAAEALRVMATKLDAPGVRRGLTSLLVVGDPGRSLTPAAELALAFAARGYTCALVAPTQVLERLRQPADGAQTVEGDVLTLPGVTGLALVTLQTDDLGAGQAAPGVRAVRRTAESYQRVVVDATGLPTSQVLALGAVVDGAVVVARQHATRRAALRGLADDLRQVEVPVLGAAVVARRPGRPEGAPPRPPRPGAAGEPDGQDVPEDVEQKVGNW